MGDSGAGILSGVHCRVLVVDDDDVFAELVMLLLEAHPEIEVVGRARDGVEAVDLAAELRPDVVTMDLEMPRMNGIDATCRLRQLESVPQVVVVSSSLFRDAIDEARRCGAQAYVTKSRVQADLANVVFAACRGEAFQEVT